jgi:hypothetical protein
MFKDTPEGKTHYENDGCGEPAHNKTTTHCCHDESNACIDCLDDSTWTASYTTSDEFLERDLLKERADAKRARVLWLIILGMLIVNCVGVWVLVK